MSSFSWRVTAIALLLVVRTARAQVIGGAVVDKATHDPLRRIRVVLFDSAGQKIHTESKTDTLGIFYVEAPAPGTYRLGFAWEETVLGASRVITVGAGDFVQRTFEVEIAPGEAYFAFQVLKQVSPYAGNPAPRYPVGLRHEGKSGEVIVQFVVDTSGRAEMATFRVLRSTHEDFTNAVRESLPRMRFYAAEIGQRHVRQLVQMPFSFSVMPYD